MIPSLDCAMRVYIPSLLDAAGLQDESNKFRFIMPEKYAYITACDKLQRIIIELAGPWLSILKTAYYWMLQAVNSYLEGNLDEVDKNVIQLQLQCTRQMKYSTN